MAAQSDSKGFGMMESIVFLLFPAQNALCSQDLNIHIHNRGIALSDTSVSITQ